MTEFPIHTLPDAIREYIIDLEKSNGFIPDYLCSAALSTLSTIIGNSAELHAQDGWNVRCSLWIAILGSSGTKKTPSIRAMTGVLNNSDDESFRAYQSEMAEYLSKIEQGETVPKPKRKRLTLDDATMESILVELYNNPHGLLIKRDELLGWINDMSRYSKSGDEQRFLSIYSGESVDVARKTSENIRITHPYLNIVGNIQPSLMDKLLTPERQVSGFVSRILFVHPKSAHVARGDGKNNEQIRSEYVELCDELMHLVKSAESCNQCAKPIHVSTHALTIYNHWRDEFIYPSLNGPESDSIKSYVSKLEETALRIALILDIAWERNFNSMISERSMKYSIEICEYYFAQFVRVTKDLKSPAADYDLALLNKFHAFVKPKMSQQDYRATVMKIGNELPAIPAKSIGETFGIPKSTLSGWTNPK